MLQLRLARIMNRVDCIISALHYITLGRYLLIVIMLLTTCDNIVRLVIKYLSYFLGYIVFFSLTPTT